MVAIPPGVKFLPNAITVLALCSGLTSVAFVHRGQFLLAGGAIATAAILDSLDGPAARLLNSTSRIGAELDSFSDLVGFGVAPAVVMYLWALDHNPIGWAICLLYAVFTTLRLARFNSALDDGNPKPWAKGFFTGVPSPAGALLAIQPMLLQNRFHDGWWTNGWVVDVWLVFVGVLMVSRMPSIALKSVFIPTRLILPSLIGLVIGVAFLFYQPVIVLALGLLVYLAHLPYASWKFRRLRRHPELAADNNQRRRIRARNARLRPRIPQRRRVAGRTRDGRPLTRTRNLLQRHNSSTAAVPATDPSPGVVKRPRRLGLGRPR
ncbi:MAG: phosphatidylcholine/phosphatidylserine synthase [Actinomycetota bacterium]|nr:phosphatidylcholine/phosphatidylserine synthase [Actinomycetota bacterium]